MLRDRAPTRLSCMTTSSPASRLCHRLRTAALAGFVTLLFGCAGLPRDVQRVALAGDRPPRPTPSWAASRWRRRPTAR